MKIIAGKYKGRILKAPKGESTRPTSSKVRASVFNTIQNQIENADFLDLFAGSGSMGIEALSRGAKKAVFVENQRAAATCLRENLKALECEGVLLQKEASLAVKLLQREGKQFDLIYVDPPYAIDISPLLEKMAPLITKEGVLILEQRKNSEPTAASLNCIDTKNYGDTVISFWILR